MEGDCQITSSNAASTPTLNADDWLYCLPEMNSLFHSPVVKAPAAFLAGLAVLLLGVLACSLIPLAGYKGGWASYHGTGLMSNILQDLSLVRIH